MDRALGLVEGAKWRGGEAGTGRPLVPCGAAACFTPLVISFLCGLGIEPARDRLHQGAQGLVLRELCADMSALLPLG